MANGRQPTMYQRVASILRDRIAYGIYPKNELLPPEMLLLAEFDVSRHTIREAMRMLVGEGLIERCPGRGTVVSPVPLNRGNWSIRSLNDLIGEFVESRIVIIRKVRIPAKQVPEAAAQLGVARNGSILHILRVMHTDAGPMALHRVYTHPEYASRLPKRDIAEHPVIELIEARCGVRAVRTRQVASAIAADAETSKLLGVHVGSPMLFLRRTYLDSSDEPIEYTELFCRPDRYHQTVEFQRAPATDARAGSVPGPAAPPGKPRKSGKPRKPLNPGKPLKPRKPGTPGSRRP